MPKTLISDNRGNTHLQPKKDLHSISGYLKAMFYGIFHTPRQQRIMVVHVLPSLYVYEHILC